MFPFLSTKNHRKDQVAARLGICIFALLFFLCAALSALPSFGLFTDWLSQKGVAGYADRSVEQDESSDRHEGALKQYTDRPLDEETSAPAKESRDQPSALIPPIDASHTAL